MTMRKAETNSLKRRRFAARTRGLTLIETALTLAIMALVVASLATMMAENADQIRARAAADKITEVHEAAQGYIKANYGALLAQAASGPVVIPSGRVTAGGQVPSGPNGLPSLQGGGFLSPGYVDANGYGQRHVLVVRRVEDNPNALEAMVTTQGGRQIPDAQLGRIANMVGAMGGFVPETPMAGSDANQVVGSYGGWRTDVSGWGGASLSPGTIQATLAFEDGQLLTDYLYRNDVGIPEANRMNTHIDMNGNEVTNLAAIRAAGGNLSIDGDTMVEGSVEASEDVIARRDVKAGRNSEAEGNVSAGQDVIAGSDVSAGRDVNALRDVHAGRNVTADYDVSAGRDLSAGGNLNVDGSSTVLGDSTVGGLLTADRIDGSVQVVGFDGFESVGATLNDLLPKTVPQYSYLVEPGQSVPMPTCRGGYGNARIMVYPQVESSRSEVTISAATGSAGAGGAAHTHPFSHTFNVDTTVAVFAVKDPGQPIWHINWEGTPAAPTGNRKAIAQTFCFYG